MVLGHPREPLDAPGRRGGIGTYRAGEAADRLDVAAGREPEVLVRRAGAFGREDEVQQAVVRVHAPWRQWPGGVEVELRGGEPQSFQLSLKTLDFARVTVAAKNVGLLIKLFAPDGKSVVEYQWNQDSPDPANLSLIAGFGGNYRIELTSQEKESKKISIKLA